MNLPSEHTVNNEIIASDQFLKFSISNLESDLGQTTIPFIDIQNVTTNVPTPMSGIGLYYRKSNNTKTAGFIGLKLKTYDLFQQWLKNEKLLN